jgi:prophage antirepressor-like protein
MNVMIEAFKYQEQADRVHVTPEEPLFVAKDVCEVLWPGKIGEDAARLIKKDSEGGDWLKHYES